MIYQEALDMLNEEAKKQVYSQALKHLRPGREIQLLVEGQPFALTMVDGAPKVEARHAALPDVEFAVDAEALRMVSSVPGDNLANYGIAILEQVALGKIRLRVVSGLWRTMQGGYLNIITAAGPDLLSYLARRGLGSVQKIVSIIKDLSKRS